MFAFSLGLNFCTAALWAVTYTFTPEVFPTELRTTVRRRVRVRPRTRRTSRACMPPYWLPKSAPKLPLALYNEPRGALAAS
jgi:hypothetical protein